LGEQRPEVGAAQAGDVEAGTLQGREQVLFDAACGAEKGALSPLSDMRLAELYETSHTW